MVLFGRRCFLKYLEETIWGGKTLLPSAGRRAVGIGVRHGAYDGLCSFRQERGAEGVRLPGGCPQGGSRGHCAWRCKPNKRQRTLLVATWLSFVQGTSLSGPQVLHLPQG